MPKTTKFSEVDVQAVSGPGAAWRLLRDFFAASDGSEMRCGVGQMESRELMVLVRVAAGPLYALTITDARLLAGFCLEFPDGGRTLRDLGRHLGHLAGEAAALQPSKFH